MKKIVFFITLFLLGISSVNASIDNINSLQFAYTVDASGNIKQTFLNTIDSLHKWGGYGFLTSGYPATINYDDGTTKNSIGFCLDPGLAYTTFVPQSGISIAPKTIYYYPYLFFYDNIKGMTGANDLGAQRASFLAALRTLTHKGDFAKSVGLGITYTDCMSGITNSTTSVSGCYNSGYQFNTISSYYKASSNSGVITLANQFKKPNFTFVEEDDPTNELYKNYKIKFNWDDMLDESKYPSVIMASGRIIDAPYLKVKEITLKKGSTGLFSIIPDSSGTYAKNYDGGYIIEIIDEPGILDTTIKVDKSAISGLTISGDLKLFVEYEWSHPLNPNNLIVGDPGGSGYQRMLLITSKKESETKIIPIVSLVMECEQVGNIFKFENVEVDMDTYLSKCGCGKISRIQLTDNVLKDKYDAMCSTTTKSEEYESTLGVCTSTNQLKHDYSKNINSSNEYCTLNCTETVTFNNFTDKFSVKAGKYFENGGNPSLNSNKLCNINVKYNDWKTKYEQLLDEQISFVNSYIYNYEMFYAKFLETDICSCDGGGSSLAEVYEYKSYEKWKRSGFSLWSYTVPKGTYKIGECCSRKTKDFDFSTPLSNAKEKTGELETLFLKLKSCNKYLYELGENYYQFKNGLSFYYQQDYANSDVGLRWNNNKPNDEDDDSVFDIFPKKDDGYTDGYKEDSSIDGGKKYTSSKFIDDNIPYSYFTNLVGGSAYPSDYNIGGVRPSNDYIIERNKLYSSEYAPKVNKYYEPFTGKIRSESRKDELANPVELGYVYDIHYSAKAKTGNLNYYNITALGDNNNIYNYFKTHDINSDGTTKLQRYCTYTITNDLLEICTGSSCEPKLDIVFNIVDSKNIDPNDRIKKTGEGFENWKDDLGTAVKNKIENDDTFNPNNLEYSFMLDSKTIKEIREYNISKDNKYSYKKLSDELTCENGIKCESGFISSYAIKDNAGSILGTGRDSWKEFSKDPLTGKCYIDLEEVNCS